ncbi:LysR family transcriptional regulator [Trinickia caryophylli]|uniref:Transcriptional regulator, LysR family n=1 Tax=Trinickia caryophylli TaxID=28094 RepID=A0A1X7D351_TRICW|nr:LysR family transcriptional regulator [Trinickia caryophylli]PMS12776.1 LysR family transcriptional regulator [Trinickia caryophylli]TRX15189.1 LysR family transcriptional regulator [Trinickia caryophylli]WQE15058.1 LysR family transcriptional regulator [Trinickia caryophylli]SMF07907.1 transcriptional regulator, LysR family [Trinickia caryophylli]
MADQICTTLDWEDVRIFVALARHGSLSGAARAISVTHATISRRIQALERTLGEKLVERRPDGYVLTPGGTRVLSAASEMEAAAARLVRDGGDGRATGLVRINALPSLTQSFLSARLAKLAAEHPALDLDIAADVRSVSLERREADVALRLGRPQDGDVIGSFLVNVGYGFYAAPAWRRRTEDGTSPVFVGFDEANAHVPESHWLKRHFPRARIAIGASSLLAQAAAAKAGAGVALLPHFLGRADEALMPCVLEPAPPTRELWLLRRRHSRNDTAVRVVVDFLTKIFSDERALFEG